MKVKKIMDEVSINMLLVMMMAMALFIKLADICDVMLLKRERLENEITKRT